MFGNIFKKDQDDSQQPNGSPSASSVQGAGSSPAGQQSTVQQPAQSAFTQPPAQQAPSAFSNSPAPSPSSDQTSPVDSTTEQPLASTWTDSQGGAPVSSDTPQNVVPQTPEPMDTTPPAQQYGSASSPQAGLAQARSAGAIGQRSEARGQRPEARGQRSAARGQRQRPGQRATARDDQSARSDRVR